MPRGRNRLSSAERIVTELKLLKEWKTIPELKEEMNVGQPTIWNDMKEFDRLGLVSKKIRDTGDRGKNPMQYRLKVKETNLLFDTKTTIEMFSVLQELNEHRGGLTSHQLGDNLNYPIAKVYRVLEFLVAIKWVRKEDPEFGPKNIKLYKPNYEIKLIGGY